jgi:tetratricopeptide (TPR) repeat protein
MLERSAAQFAQATRIAPQSALGYAGLAEDDASLAFYATDPARQAYLQAQSLTLARKAVATDTTSAEAYAALGGVELNIEHDTVAAGNDLGEALRRNPNEVSALLWNGKRCLDDGDTSSARHMFARAVAIAPNTAGGMASLAWTEFIDGDATQAAALSRQMLAANQSPTLALLTLAEASLAEDDLLSARAAIGRLLLDPQSALAANAMAARLDLLSGRRNAATVRLGRIEADTNPSQVDSWDAATIAAAYVAMGDRPRAYLWLERVRLWERGGVAKDPRFAALRADPEFSRWING